jgi:hypothetical protein
VSPSPRDLRSLEGRRVGLALADGSRIDDCQFVAAPRGDLRRVWVCVDGNDLFLPAEDINDVWEARPPSARRTC